MMKANILLLGLIAALAVILGGSMIAARRSWPKHLQELLLSLGAGFILALVFLKLIPVSFDAIGEAAAFALLLGFATIHFFEHTVVTHLHFGEETHTEIMVSHSAALSTMVGLSIHAFFDGLTISVGLQYDFHLGVLIFIAVMLHKFPEGLTVGSIMMASGFRRRTIVLTAVAIGVATLVGAGSALLVEHVSSWMAGAAFAFSAGTVVYVGASDLIPEINKSESRIPPLLVFAGMLLFAASDWLLETVLR